LTFAIGFLVLRLVVGLTVAAHGAQKLFGWFGGPRIAGFAGMLEKLGIAPSRPWAIIAGLTEFLGGLSIAAGFLTTLGSLAVAGSMAVAIITVHLSKGFWNRNGGYEFPLVLAAAALALSLIGPGSMSLDALLRIQLPEPATWIAMAVLVLLAIAGTVVLPRLRERQRRLQVG
jgi:putative oxidoreductase